MDEPTSALSASEVEVLFGVIDELTAAGVAIVYISHHLEEALEIADHVVVFRDGELVDQAPAGEIDIEWVISRMVGRSATNSLSTSAARRRAGAVTRRRRGRRSRQPAPPRRGRRLARRAGRRARVPVRPDGCRAHGTAGSARRPPPDPLWHGRRSTGRTLTDESIGERIDLGLALVPEDRQRDGLVQTMAVGHNLSLASLLSFVRRRLVVRGRAHRRGGRSIDREMRVKAAGPQAPITSLSGGNQQKVVIGRALMTRPQALLLDEPTRGIDVGAKSEIFSLMADEAERGLAVLVRHVGDPRSAHDVEPHHRAVERQHRRRVRPGDGHQGRGDARLRRGRVDAPATSPSPGRRRQGGPT